VKILNVRPSTLGQIQKKGKVMNLFSKKTLGLMALMSSTFMFGMATRRSIIPANSDISLKNNQPMRSAYLMDMNDENSPTTIAQQLAQRQQADARLIAACANQTQEINHLRVKNDGYRALIRTNKPAPITGIPDSYINNPALAAQRFQKQNELITALCNNNNHILACYLGISHLTEVAKIDALAARLYPPFVVPPVALRSVAAPTQAAPAPLQIPTPAQSPVSSPLFTTSLLASSMSPSPAQNNSFLGQQTLTRLYSGIPEFVSPASIHSPAPIVITTPLSATFNQSQSGVASRSSFASQSTSISSRPSFASQSTSISSRPSFASQSTPASTASNTTQQTVVLLSPAAQTPQAMPTISALTRVVHGTPATPQPADYANEGESFTIHRPACLHKAPTYYEEKVATPVAAPQLALQPNISFEGQQPTATATDAAEVSFETNNNHGLFRQTHTVYDTRRNEATSPAQYTAVSGTVAEESQSPLRQSVVTAQAPIQRIIPTMSRRIVQTAEPALQPRKSIVLKRGLRGTVVPFEVVDAHYPQFK
jgi:hypothetical protein